MMVSAVSGSGTSPAESGDGRGWDEDGFASILASLVGAATTETSGGVPPVSVTRTGEPAEPHLVGGVEPDASVATSVGADADGEETLFAGDPPMPLETQAAEVQVAPRAAAAGSPDGAESGPPIVTPAPPVAPESGSETPPAARDPRSDPRWGTPIVGDAASAGIDNAAPVRMDAVDPNPADAVTHGGDPMSDLSLPPASARAAGGEPTAPARPDIESEAVADVQTEDRSSLADEQSFGSDRADGVRPAGPSLRFEPTADHASAGTAPAGPGAGELTSDPVAGADTDARVEAIREVVEWLESVGLESTPGEMRVEIPDTEGELIVRVTVVDGRLEVDASGSDASLPERWLDDLRRELDARGFGFAGSRQGRQEQAKTRDDAGAAADTNATRRDTRAGSGVLL